MMVTKSYSRVSNSLFAPPTRHSQPPTTHPLFLNIEPIEYVKEWRYLGALVLSGKSFSLTPRNDLRNFYSSFNSLYNSNMRPNEVILMRLLFSICVPHLSYVADVKDLSSSDMQKCNTTLKTR